MSINTTKYKDSRNCYRLTPENAYHMVNNPELHRTIEVAKTLELHLILQGKY